MTRIIIIGGILLLSLTSALTLDEDYLSDLEFRILELLGSRSSQTIPADQMGMEDGSITIDMLSSSSCYQYPDCEDRARLDQGPGNGRRGAWCAASDDYSPWIQVNFGKGRLVTGIVTQGRDDNTYQQWVTSFTVQYATDCTSALSEVLDDTGSPKTFPGNGDMNTKVTNMFPTPVIACVVRILPLNWVSHCSMRFDLLGDVTAQRLGIEDRSIPDSRLSASSCYDYPGCATRGRLNQLATSRRRGAWCAASSDQSPWIQVDLGTNHRVDGVITQGRYFAYNQWVSSYGVQYKAQGASSFEDVAAGDGQPKVFQGNVDMNTEFTNLLPAPVVARYVRILPKTWNNHVCMRFELFGSVI